MLQTSSYVNGPSLVGGEVGGDLGDVVVLGLGDGPQQRPDVDHQLLVRRYAVPGKVY